MLSESTILETPTSIRGPRRGGNIDGLIIYRDREEIFWMRQHREIWSVDDRGKLEYIYRLEFL